MANPTCFFLTPAELQALLDQGYALQKNAGPFATQAECLANCGASSSSSPSSSSSGMPSSSSSPPKPILTGCCPNPIPTTLYCSLENVFDCDCAIGASVKLTYDPDQEKWIGAGPFGTCPDSTIDFAFYCDIEHGSEFWLIIRIRCVGVDVTDTKLQLSAICDPLNVVFGTFSAPSYCGCGISGDFTFRVTQ